MIKTRIIAAIREILDNDCGFDAFVMMKDDSRIKRLNLYEGKPERGEVNFKEDIGLKIKKTIIDKFLADDAEYCLGEQIEDNQKKFYVIRQDKSYEPFPFIDNLDDEILSFSMSEQGSAQGFLFCFAVNGSRKVWAYQHIWASTIPKKKNNRLMKILSDEQDDIFVEMTDALFPITQKVDVLIVSSKPEEGDGMVSEIITSDISLMERTFHLETFIRASAFQVIDAISSVGLVGETDKLTEYLKRSGGNKRYSRRMMRIKNSKVFEMSAEALREKIETVPRWQGIFELKDGKIRLNSFKNVEDLIDLFDERYTRSDITGQEYDTSVKSVVKDVGESGHIV